MERIRRDDSGCWLWSGRTDRAGYGVLSVGNTPWRAHRYIYTELVGPIPADLELDHLCRVTGCVNPDHLEPVTTRENLARSTAPSAHAIRTDECIHGHPLIEANVYRSPARPNARTCRTCIKDRYLAKKTASPGSGTGLTQRDELNSARTGWQHHNTARPAGGTPDGP